MTITYGALTPEYLAQRLGRPDPSQYPLGTNDPTFTKAMTDVDTVAWHGLRSAISRPDGDDRPSLCRLAEGTERHLCPVASDSAQIRIGTGDLSAAVDILKGTAPGYELRSHTGNALTDYNIVVINKRLIQRTTARVGGHRPRDSKSCCTKSGTRSVLNTPATTRSPWRRKTTTSTP
jgi:hypothetical protein